MTTDTYTTKREKKATRYKFKKERTELEGMFKSLLMFSEYLVYITAGILVGIIVVIILLLSEYLIH